MFGFQTNPTARIIELDVNVTLNGKSEWSDVVPVTNQELGCQKIPGIPFPISVSFVHSEGQNERESERERGREGERGGERGRIIVGNEGADD